MPHAASAGLQVVHSSFAKALACTYMDGDVEVCVRAGLVGRDRVIARNHHDTQLAELPLRPIPSHPSTETGPLPSNVALLFPVCPKIEKSASIWLLKGR